MSNIFQKLNKELSKTFCRLPLKSQINLLEKNLDMFCNETIFSMVDPANLIQMFLKNFNDTSPRVFKILRKPNNKITADEKTEIIYALFRKGILEPSTLEDVLPVQQGKIITLATGKFYPLYIVIEGLFDELSRDISNFSEKLYEVGYRYNVDIFGNRIPFGKSIDVDGNIVDADEITTSYICKLTTTDSLHERACDVFYQLVGGKTDYGAEFSRKMKIPRYGKDNGKGFIPNWHIDMFVTFHAASLGGTTAYKFVELFESGFFRKLDDGTFVSGDPTKGSPFYDVRLLPQVATKNTILNGIDLIPLLGFKRDGGWYNGSPFDFAIKLFVALTWVLQKKEIIKKDELIRFDKFGKNPLRRILVDDYFNQKDGSSMYDHHPHIRHIHNKKWRNLNVRRTVFSVSSMFELDDLKLNKNIPNIRTIVSDDIDGSIFPFIAKAYDLILRNLKKDSLYIGYDPDAAALGNDGISTVDSQYNLKYLNGCKLVEAWKNRIIFWNLQLPHPPANNPKSIYVISINGNHYQSPLGTDTQNSLNIYGAILVINTFKETRTASPETIAKLVIPGLAPDGFPGPIELGEYNKELAGFSQPPDDIIAESIRLREKINKRIRIESLTFDGFAALGKIINIFR